jgi:nucleoside-diphosphate-sugar epimerase
VVQALQRAGHQLMVFHRGQSSLPLPEGVQEVLGDRRNLKEFAAPLRAFAPDAVLDMIPRTVQEVWTLINVFRCPQRRLVVISSADVYRNYGRLIGLESGPADPTPLVESAPLRHKLFPFRSDTPAADQPEWYSDYDKILIEKIALSEPDMPGVVLRLPMVYGPNDAQHRLFPYVKRMADQRPAILLDDQAARWRNGRIFAENAAAAIVLALTHPQAAGRVYNVAGRRALTETEWVRSIAQVFGWNGTIMPIRSAQLPPHLQEPADWSQHLDLDTSRIRSELGYHETVTIEDALRRTIEWELANPPDFSADAFDYTREDEVLRSLA